MKTATYDRKRLSIATRTLLILFAALVIFTILQWGIASDWGNIKIQRITFINKAGGSQSGLLFVPNTATPETPAPAIVNVHGRNNSSYNMINWAIEQARRGYVVLNPDRSGSIDTERDIRNDNNTVLTSAIYYLNGLNFVTDISLTGHSAGAIAEYSISQNQEFDGIITNIVSVSNPRLHVAEPSTYPSYANYAIITGTRDIFHIQYAGSYDVVREGVAQNSGLYDDFEIGKLYGDPVENTAFIVNDKSFCRLL